MAISLIDQINGKKKTDWTSASKVTQSVTKPSSNEIKRVSTTEQYAPKNVLENVRKTNQAKQTNRANTIAQLRETKQKNDIHNKIYDESGNTRSTESLQTLKRSLVNNKLEDNNNLSYEDKKTRQEEINKVTDAIEYNKAREKDQAKVDKIDTSNWFDELGNLRDFNNENQQIESNINNLTLKRQELENELAQGNLTRQNEYAQLLGDLASLNKSKMDNDKKLKDLDLYNRYYGTELARKEAFQNKDYESLDYLTGLEGASDDNFLQRFAGATAKNILQITNMPDQLMDLGKDVYGELKAKALEEQADSLFADGRITQADRDDKYKTAQVLRDFDSQNPNNVSKRIDKYISELNERTYYNLNDVESVMLQALDSTENFLMQYALFGEFSTAVMGTQSGIQKTNENLQKGYDMTTSVMNGTLTGLVSYGTEKIGMDNFVSLLNNKAGQFALATHMENIVNATLSQGSSEALEELVEGLADQVVDFGTHILNNEFTVEKLDVNDLTQSMLIAFLSGGGTGAFSGMKFNISTQQEANKIRNDINALTQVYNEALRTNDTESVQMCEEAIKLGNVALYNFDSQSIMKDAVEFASDKVIDTNMSLSGARDYLVKSLQPNFKAEANQKLSELEQVKLVRDELNATATNILSQKGINYDADSFIKLNDEKRSNLVKLNDSLKTMGVENYRFEDIKTKDGTVVDGYYDNKNNVFVVNPNGYATPTSIAIHELTHSLENNNNPDLKSDYLLLESEVLKQVREDGMDFLSGINEVQNRYVKAGIDQSFASSRADFIAEQLQNRLGNEQFLNKLVKYNNNVVYKIYEDSFLAKDDDVTKSFLSAFRNKFRNGDYGYVGESYYSPEDVQLSINQLENGGWEVFEKFVEVNELPTDTVDSLRDRVNQIKGWAQDKKAFKNFWKWQNTDFRLLNGKNGEFTIVVQNGDYELNIDFSTVCKKRELQDRVIWEMSNKGLLDKEYLKPMDFVALRQIIKNHNLEVACGVCFVDSKRFRTGTWANSLTTTYNRHIRALTPKGFNTNTMNYSHSVGIVDSPNALNDLTIEDIKRLNPKGYESVVKASQEVTPKGGKPTKRSQIARFILEGGADRLKLLNDADFYSSGSLDNMKMENNPLYNLAYGWGGQSKPKTPFAQLSYDNTLIKNDKFTSAAAFDMGGFRLQSFSDYQSNMIIDYLCLFAEAQAKGLPMQAYTKVEDFAKIFGMTGAKINLSIINLATNRSQEEVASLMRGKTVEQKNKIRDREAGLRYYTTEEVQAMSNDERTYLETYYGLAPSIEHEGYTAYLIDEVYDPEKDQYGVLTKKRTVTESYDWRKAIELQNTDGYRGNVGTIVIGFGREHILKLLADNNVKMVIPYHKSGINGTVAKSMNLEMIKDYTYAQTTKDSEGKTIAHNKDFKFYESLRRTGDARATANEYLAWCEENGYTPKFEEFVRNSDGTLNNNYYKLLVDFNTYSDAENTIPAPQNAVEFTLPNDFEDIVKNSLVEYEKDQNEKTTKTPEIIKDFNNYLMETGRDINAIKNLRRDQELSISQQAVEETQNTETQEFDGKAKFEQIVGNEFDEDIEKTYNDLVQMNPISKRTQKNLAKYENELASSIKEWFPNYEVVKGRFNDLLQFDSQVSDFDKALFDMVSYGDIQPSTKENLKESLKSFVTNNYGHPQLNERTQEEVDLAIDSILNDSLAILEGETKYQRDAKYLNSVTRKANKIDEGFANGSMDTQTYLDEVERFKKAYNTDQSVKEVTQEFRDGVSALPGMLYSGGVDWNSSAMTMEQLFDKVGSKSPQLREELQRDIELPRFEAQGRYNQEIEKGRTVVNKVRDLGINAGSPESYAITSYIEGKANGMPFTESDLKSVFDYKMNNGKFAYENIIEASKLIRAYYEEQFGIINDQRVNMIYGDVEQKARQKLADASAKYKYALMELNGARKRLSQNLTDENLIASVNQAQKVLNARLNEYNRLARDIDNKDETRRQLLPYKENYTHHTFDKSFVRRVKDVFGYQPKVTNKLAGISQDVKPKSVFARFFLHQSENTEGLNDALTNLADYVYQSAKVIAYDPLVDYYRTVIQSIRDYGPNRTDMNNFLIWMTNYTNDLVGKRQGIDREVDNFGNVTSKGRDIANLLSSRAKTSALTGNVRSSFVQWANIPNGISILAEVGKDGLTDFTKGSISYLTNANKELAPHTLSHFLKNRFDSKIDVGKKGVKESMKKVTDAMMTYGDEIATKMIWYGGYEQALRLKVEDPIFYADDIARRSVAGRGIGEVPVGLKSAVANFFIPFQVEVNNQFHTTMSHLGKAVENVGIITSNLKNKYQGYTEVESINERFNNGEIDAKTRDELLSQVKPQKQQLNTVMPLVALEVAIWLMNGAYEKILNDRVIEGDFIDAIIQGLKKSDEEGDDIYLATYMLGEALSTIPGSSLIASVSGLSDTFEQNAEKYFGDSDPTRYGTGNIALGGLSDALGDAIQGDTMGAISDLFGAYGNRQIQRSIQGAQSLGYLPSYNPQGTKEGIEGIYAPVLDPNNWKRTNVYRTKSGKVGFVNKNNIENLGDLVNVLKTIAFGKWNSKAAQDYIEGGFKAMGSKQTETFDQMVEEGTSSFDAFRMIKDINNKVKDIKSDDNSNNKEQLLETLGKAMEEENYDYKELNTLYDQQYGSSKFNTNTNSAAEVYGWSDETRYKIKEASAIESLKDENGESIKNSRALQVRQTYIELGVYDDIIQYCKDNGLNYGDFNLNKTVVGWDEETFQNNYNVIVKGEKGTVKSSKTSSKKKSSKKKSSKKKSSKKKSSVPNIKFDVNTVLKGNLANNPNNIDKTVSGIRKRMTSDPTLSQLIREFKKRNPGTTLFDD